MKKSFEFILNFTEIMKNTFYLLNKIVLFLFDIQFYCYLNTIYIYINIVNFHIGLKYNILTKFNFLMC